MARINAAIPFGTLRQFLRGVTAAIVTAGIVQFSACTPESSEPSEGPPVDSPDGNRENAQLMVSSSDPVVDWSVHYDLGVTYLAGEDYLQALSHFQLAIASAHRKEDIAAARYAVGIANIESGFPGPGAENIRTAVQCNPDFYTGALFWLGRATLAEGNPSGAVSLLSAYYDRNPLDYDGALWLGRARLEQGAVDEARDLFAVAVAGDPNSAQYHHWIGVAATQRLDYEKAADSLKRAIKLDPTHADSYWELSRLYHLQGEIERAAASAGDLWLVAGDAARAEDLLHSLYRAAQSNVAVRRQLGRLDIAQSQFKEAVALLQSVTGDPSATATDHAYLGWALVASSQLAEAQEAFDAAITANPAHTFAMEGHCWLALLRGTPPHADWESLTATTASPVRVATARYWAGRMSGPTQNSSRDAGPSGKFSALGAAGFWNGGFRVLAVLEASPAFALGIRPGDVITDIDGVSLDGERDWDTILGPTSSTDVAIVSWANSGEPRTGVAVYADTAPHIGV